MLIKRMSPVTGKENEMDLPITQEQINKWQAGEKIQDVFPTLTPTQREFIKTGLTQEDWDTIFPPEDD